MTVVMTGLFGSYDTPFPQVQQDVPTTWVCFTDDPHLEAPKPWTTICIGSEHPARALAHPRMRTVWFKAQPWLGTDSERVVWIDANMEVFSPSFVREILAITGDAPIGAYRHNARDCIYEEAVASLELQPEKYGGLPLIEQVESYRTAGHPEHGGLWSVGVLAVDCTNPAVRAMGERWLAECERWTYQTQLSFPVVCAEFGIEPVDFAQPIIPCDRCVPGSNANRWFHINAHLRND